MTGQDLRLRRVAMDVTASALAERIGVLGPTISRWENHRRPRAQAVERYLKGLATFGTIPTITVAEGLSA